MSISAILRLIENDCPHGYGQSFPDVNILYRKGFLLHITVKP